MTLLKEQFAEMLDTSQYENCCHCYCLTKSSMNITVCRQIFMPFVLHGVKRGLFGNSDKENIWS